MKKTILMSALALFAISALSIQNVEAQDVKKNTTSTEQTAVKPQTADEKDVVKPDAATAADKNVVKPKVATSTKEVNKDKSCCTEKKEAKDEKAKKECCSGKDVKKVDGKQVSHDKTDGKKHPEMKPKHPKDAKDKKPETKEEKNDK